VDEYLSELERLEMAKKWWRENYKSILLGALIAVVVVGGWRYWQYRVQSRSEAAAAMFAELLTSMQKHDDTASLAASKQIIDQYGDTAYAAQAALAAAQVQVTAGKFADGEKLLQWAIDHGKDPGLQLLARLRLGRVQLADGDAKTALTTLDVADAGAFAPLFDSVRGDAELKLGDAAAARAAYQKALDAWTDDLGDRSLVKMKLDGLPGAATAAPAATTHKAGKS
jgi:predicted negative regulator of RcsB-dependent stress response